MRFLRTRSGNERLTVKKRLSESLNGGCCALALNGSGVRAAPSSARHVSFRDLVASQASFCTISSTRLSKTWLHSSAPLVQTMVNPRGMLRSLSIKKSYKSRFFAVRHLPKEHEKVIAEWVKGTAFSEILNGRGVKDAQHTQIFVQEGLVFRLVWAAEAVRVQAISSGHSRAGELGDGPAFSLTYGVSSIPAALLCQIGFHSRVGATWLTRELSAGFTDMTGLRIWLGLNNSLLSDPDFWESDDQFKLWSQISAPTNVEVLRQWNHANYTVPVEWQSKMPPVPNSQVRIIAGNGRTGTICATDLTPLGVAQFPFDPHGAALEGNVISDGQIQIAYFGK
jgi:hypothetical protein